MGWVWEVFVWVWPASLLILIPLLALAVIISNWFWGPRWEKQHHMSYWYDARDPMKKPIDHTRPRPVRPAPKPKPKVWGVDD